MHWMKLQESPQVVQALQKSPFSDAVKQELIHISTVEVVCVCVLFFFF